MAKNSKEQAIPSTSPVVIVVDCGVTHSFLRRLCPQIQTTSQSTPMQAYNLANTDLTRELDHLKVAFEQEMAQKQADYY
jgi:DNA-directed RNA polymerase II subunit RPB11